MRPPLADELRRLPPLSSGLTLESALEPALASVLESALELGRKKSVKSGACLQNNVYTQADSVVSHGNGESFRQIRVAPCKNIACAIQLRLRIYPRFKSRGRRPRIERGGIGNIDKIIHAVKAECLPVLARGKGCPAQ